MLRMSRLKEGGDKDVKVVYSGLTSLGLENHLRSLVTPLLKESIPSYQNGHLVLSDTREASGLAACFLNHVLGFTSGDHNCFDPCRTL